MIKFLIQNQNKSWKNTKRIILDDKKIDLKGICKDSKRRLPENYGENNVGLTLPNVKYITNIENLFVENITEIN